MFAANLASETLKQLAATIAGVQGAATGDTISLKPGRKELDAAIEAIQTVRRMRVSLLFYCSVPPFWFLKSASIFFHSYTDMNELPTKARNATEAINAIVGIKDISANTNRTKSLPS